MGAPRGADPPVTFRLPERLEEPQSPQVVTSSPHSCPQLPHMFLEPFGVPRLNEGGGRDPLEVSGIELELVPLAPMSGIGFATLDGIELVIFV